MSIKKTNVLDILKNLLESNTLNNSLLLHMLIFKFVSLLLIPNLLLLELDVKQYQILVISFVQVEPVLAVFLLEHQL